MTLDTFETVLVACIFIIPGFITDSVIKLFVTRPARKSPIQLLYFLFYSILNLAILCWLYFLIWEKYQSEPIKLLFFLTSTALGSSLLLGAIIGLSKRFELPNRLLKLLKCGSNHEIPTAWDYYFSKAAPCYVIVNLTDGTTIYGLYDQSSYCANTEDGQDIYLQEIYDVDSNGIWTVRPTSLGIYINGIQIKSVEFYKGNDENEQQETIK